MDIWGWWEGSPGEGAVIIVPVGGVKQCPWLGFSRPLVSCCSFARLHDGLV